MIFRRAMRLDGRVALLNTHVVQNFNPEHPRYCTPHRAARVIRLILVPVKLVKICRYYIASRMSERQARLSSGGDSCHIDLEAAEEIEFASEKPCMARFRKSLDCTFGPEITVCILTEINVLFM